MIMTDLRQRIEAELRGNILPFWITYTLDEEHGGFYGALTNDLVVHNDAPRSAVLTARILWTYSTAYQLYHDECYLQMARHAYAYLTQKFDCRFGVVISASHNPYEDNGIKFFDARGSKLSDETEARIEALLDGPALTRESVKLGRATRVDKSRVVYQEFCASTIPQGTDLSGLKIVIDCAHGAAYKVAPRVLTDLGAEIIPIGCSPNGRNINLRCGSMAPELLQLTVSGVGADVGIALDGDGDRLVMVDHLGRLVDGDRLLYVIARDRHGQGELKGPVVGTVMSNLGLEQSLQADGIRFLRAPVGDRYVLAMLREHGGVLGGETSGHLLCLDRTTTGDGLVSALQVLAVMKRTGRPLAELTAGMPQFPQVMVNVRVRERIDPRQSPGIQAAVSRVEAALGRTGRVVLRASGTEPLIRVMVEGEDEAVVTRHANELAETVRRSV
jgi:phosphoglucosamine mutase